jgi:hypothetical protein
MITESKGWWDVALIRSYDDAAALWKTVRFPHKGKPLKTNFRMYEEQGEFLFEYGENIFAVLDRNNVLTLQNIYMGSAHYKVLPIFCASHGSYYRIGFAPTLPVRTDYMQHFDWKKFKANSPQFFEGIQFNIATGECLNRKVDAKYRVNKSKQQVWVKALRGLRFKLTVMDRLGLGGDLISNLPDLYSEVQSKGAIGVIYEALVKQEVTPVLAYLVLNQGKMAEGFEVYIRKFRVQLREKFGAFNE